MAILSNVMEQGQIFGKNSSEMGKTAVLAGLGVFSFMEEKSKSLLERLVGKGQKYQSDELTVITDKVNALRGSVKDSFYAKEKVIETRLQSAFSGVLNRLGVPSKSEITNLISHVEALTKKVEKLKKG